MTVITFDGVTLPTPAPLKYKETADSYEITIEVFADDRTEIDLLIAKTSHAATALLISGKNKVQNWGTKADLVVGSDTYTNCVITGDVQVEEVGGTGPTPKWRYNVTFVQETAT